MSSASPKRYAGPVRATVCHPFLLALAKVDMRPISTKVWKYTTGYADVGMKTWVAAVGLRPDSSSRIWIARNLMISRESGCVTKSGPILSKFTHLKS
jgi:hypothetical protein